MSLTGKRESVPYGGEEQSQGEEEKRWSVEGWTAAVSANCSEKQVFSSQVQAKLLF